MLDETVYAKNVGRALLIKDLETHNKGLRSHVMELYSLCNEKTKDGQHFKDEHDNEFLQSFKKSDDEIKTALTVLNVHLNELVDRVNELEFRRTSIEKELPPFNQNYQQTLKQLFGILDCYRKREKCYKKNEVLEQNITQMSELIEKCYNEMQKVQGSLSLKQDEATKEKGHFLDILEKVEKFKFKEEILLKTQEEQASKLSSLVQHQNQIIKLQQENENLKESQEKTIEHQKELSKEIGCFQTKVKHLDEIIEDNKNIINTLKNERDYEVGRAKKFEQLTIDTKKHLKEEITQKNDLVEKNKLLEDKITELQIKLQKMQEQKIMQDVIEKKRTDRHKVWNITDSESVHTSTSFNSISFSYVADNPEPVQSQRKLKFLGRSADPDATQSSQVKRFHLTQCKQFKNMLTYTKSQSSTESELNRSIQAKRKWTNSQ